MFGKQYTGLSSILVVGDLTFCGLCCCGTRRYDGGGHARAQGHVFARADGVEVGTLLLCGILRTGKKIR